MTSRRRPTPTDAPSPNDLAAEQAVLGAMLHDGEAAAEAARTLRPEHLYAGRHRTIFEAMRTLLQQGKPLDHVTLAAELGPRLDDVGGRPYLVNLLAACPSPANVGAYVETVRDCADRRRRFVVGQLFQTGDPEDEQKARAMLAEVTPAEPESPGSAPVPDLVGVLDQAEQFLRRYIAFQAADQSAVCALWAATTHVIQAFEIAPYLHVSSPEMGSGKTNLLKCLELLVRAPWRAVEMSGAVVFRKLDRDGSTLLLDEVDAIFKGQEERAEDLRAILNAGYERGGRVSKCIRQGEDFRDFRCFGPKALAGLGDLPATLADRCIPIRLARRAPHETIAPFRQKRVKADATPLRQWLASWAATVPPTFGDAEREIPSGLHDRAADLWEPLLAVADLAGGPWPVRARQAALSLSGGQGARDRTAGVEILAAIRAVFNEEAVSAIATADLLRALVDRDDNPAPEWWGRQVAADETCGPARRLARLLGQYDKGPGRGRIEPDKWRDTGKKTVRGYQRSDFENAWQRYLPPAQSADLPPGAPNAATAATRQAGQWFAGDSNTATEGACGGKQTERKALSDTAGGGSGGICPLGDGAAAPDTFWVAHGGRRLTVHRRLPGRPERQTVPRGARTALDQAAACQGLAPRWPAPPVRPAVPVLHGRYEDLGSGRRRWVPAEPS